MILAHNLYSTSLLCTLSTDLFYSTIKIAFSFILFASIISLNLDLKKYDLCKHKVT